MIALCSMPALLIASLTPAEALTEEARRAEDGDYAASAARYDELETQGASNGEFHLNQGNAHYLAGNLAEAMLAYRRAERLMPNDGRLQANLAEVRARVLDAPPDQTVWPASVPRLGRGTQARLALLLYLIGWLTMTLWLWRPRRRLLWAALACWVAGLALGAFVWYAEQRDRRYPLGVVRADEVVPRKGNGESYPACEKNQVAVKLHEGVELRVIGQRKNGWVQVVLGDGTLGWLPRGEVLMDREIEAP